MATQQFTSGQLLRRSLTPSSISGFLCITFSLLLTIAHVVLLSVSVGTSLPGLLDGQWSLAYTENIVQPLSAFFTNQILNKLLVASLWGIVGLGVYLGFEYGLHAYHTAQETQRQVALGANATWQRKPLQSYFMQNVLWRLAIIVLTIAFFATMLPLFRFAFETAPQVVVSQDLVTDGLRLLAAAGVWALFFHGVVVLLRLFTRRTRLFGDDKLY